MRRSLWMTDAPGRRRAALAGLFLLAACTRDLALPPAFTPPVIAALEPAAAYAQESIYIRGTNFEPVPADNQIRFPGGFVVGADRVDSGGIWVTVPTAVRDYGSVAVSNRSATAISAQSFSPLGYGHPTMGTLVAELRFRHRPVGLINRAATILVASTLFDAVIDDAGAFQWLDGRPTAFERSGTPGLGILAISLAGGGGALQEVDVDDGGVVSKSAVSEVVEQLILPVLPGPAAGQGGLIAQSIGQDAQGRTWVTSWQRDVSGGAPVLQGTRFVLPVVQVQGAALYGSTLGIAATVLDSAGDASQVLALVSPQGALTTRWVALPDAGVPVRLAGPMVLTNPAGTPGAPPTVAVAGLADGDLALIHLDGTPWQRTRMISFNPANSMTLNTASKTGLPDKVLLTKPLDGALFQFDVNTRMIEWVVQLHGSPEAIDVAPDLDEIAVSNSDDNFVDVVDSTAGTWKGRSSMSLGLGSADNGEGGAVAPYSYDPAAPQHDNVIHILSRSAPMVIVMDPNALNILGLRLLDASSPPLRLAVTPDLHTLVVHSAGLGLLGDTGDEQVATTEPLPQPPTSVGFLRDGRVLVASLAGVDVYQWSNGQSGTLRKQGALLLPAGATPTGLVAHLARIPGRNDFGDGGKDWLAVTWQSSAGLGGGLYTVPATFSGKVAMDSALSLPGGVGAATGFVDLLDGPAAVFARSATPGGPALLNFASMRGLGKALTGLTDGPQVTRATPDGRFVVWNNQGAGDHVVRIVQYSARDGLVPYSGYRFDSHAAGPGLDPSGEWLYVPVPADDMVAVQQ